MSKRRFSIDGSYDHSEETEKALRKRIKELIGLNDLRLLTDRIKDRKELLNKFVKEIVPRSMQHPENVLVQVELDGKTYNNRKGNHKNSLSAPIIVKGIKRGSLEVSYSKNLPFIETFEQNLIDNYAGILEKAIGQNESEEELKQSKEKANRIISTITDGMDIVDENLNILWMNDIFLKIFGKKALGKKCYRVYRDNKKQCKDCPLKKLIKIGDTKTTTTEGVAGGKKFEITHTGTTFDGKKAVLEIFRDITEKEKLEEALRESEKKHKLLYETSNDAIMTLAPPSWKFTSGNPTTVKMFKTKNEKEFVSLGPWQLSPKYQPDGQLSNVKAKKMIMKAMKEGKNFFEWTHKRYKGEEFPATVLLSRMTLDNKTFLQATVRDIGEEKKFRDALKKAKEELEIRVEKRTEELTHSEMLLQEAQRLAMMGSWSMNLKTNKIRWSDNRYRLFGTEQGKQKLTIKTFTNFIKKEERKRVVNLVEDALRNRKDYSFEYQTIPIEGKEKTIHSTIHIISDEKGKPIMIHGVDQDITQRKEIDILKDELIAIAGHELKTPLTSIISITQSILDKYLGDINEEQSKALSLVNEEGKRLGKIIESMLNISRLEQGRMKYQFSNIELVGLCRQLLDATSGLAKENNITSTITNRTPIMVRGDLLRISEVITNLISNAIKYDKKKGHIKISIKKKGGKAIVSVMDDGIGIAKENLPKVFDKMYRVETGAQRSTGGTGLGLYVSKRIIEEGHKEKMWVESKLGKGSTFYFSLPLSK